MTKKNISIVIVNYKTPLLSIDCIESIYNNIPNAYDISVIVADNNSEDDSVSTITDEIKRRAWDSWVSIKPLSENGGFAFGNNRVIEKILNLTIAVDFIWLLNPDTVIYNGACEKLVDFMSSYPNAGIAGSRLEGVDGKPQVSAFKFHTIMSEALSALRLGFLDKLFRNWIVASTPIASEPHQTDWVSGASLFIRREVFEQVGMLDEKYFMYFEEVDFCYRTRFAGWEIWYVPESRVMHLEGAASNILNGQEEIPRKPQCWFESRRRYFLKNHGWPTLLLADTAWVVGYSIWRIRRLIQRKPDCDPPNFLKDFIKHSFLCKGLGL